MNFIRFTIAAFLLAMLFAGAIAATGAQDVPRRYRIEAGKVRIEKGEELTTAKLSGGVFLVSRDGTKISASEGVIEIVSRAVDAGLDTAAESAQAMAPGGESVTTAGRREISPDDVKYIELSGGVTMTGADGIMKCDAVFSTDGGRTWQTRGRASFDGKGENAGVKFSAGTVKFDSAKKSVSGGGGATVTLPASDSPGGGKSPVNVKAGGFAYDLKTGNVTLTGSPVVTQGNSSFSAATIEYSVKNGVVVAKGGARVKFPSEKIEASSASATYGKDGIARFKGGVKVMQADGGNTLTCDALEYTPETGAVKARGNVKLTIPRENITLTAGTLDGNLKDESGAARENPVLQRGADYVKGEEIRFKRSGEKIVVEVLGGDKTEYSIDPESFE